MGFFSLPLWERVARTKSVPGEGEPRIREVNPLTRLNLASLN
jgi:hypothetical protein